MLQSLSATWINRGVKIKAGCYPDQIGKSAVVLAVDRGHERPMAWVKVDTGTEVPGYLTVELSWLENLYNEEPGTF